MRRFGRSTYGDVKFIRGSTRWRSAGISAPSTVARPAVGVRSPSSIESVVVLPAPLPPRSAVVVPRRTANETRSTATMRPYDFDRSATTIAESIDGLGLAQHWIVCLQYCASSRTTVVPPTAFCAFAWPCSIASLNSYFLKKASNCSAPTVPSAASSSVAAS